MFAEDPNHQPGGAYWHRDHPDYDKIRADCAEFLAVMLWEEMVYLRNGTEPEGYGIPREARLRNIAGKTNEYLFWAKKDLRPRGLWDQPLWPLFPEDT